MSIESRAEKQTVSNSENRIADAYTDQVQKINQDTAKQIQDARNGAAAWDAAALAATVLSAPLQVLNMLGGCTVQDSNQNRKSGDSGNSGTSKNSGDANNSGDTNSSDKKRGLSQDEKDACQAGGASLSEEDKKLCRS